MDHLVDLLSDGAVAAGLIVPGRKGLFAQLGQMAEREYGLDAASVIERLTERERLGSTGFGAGVAIPHGKVDGLEHVVGLFVQLQPPVDFDAIDDLPVDLVFCLLSPPDSGAEHLKALALVSRWMRDSAFVAKLRGAASSDAVLALFAAAQTRDAA
ncbi:MAG: PTS sugar transporter subunit IIA [Sphingomonadales bacterium]|jgi:PTS system nitrogen regulatory IIA component|nr:PTS sugar transporter subunit IIA [Sphingomonadales bacterium]